MKDFKNYNGENNGTNSARSDNLDGGTRTKNSQDKGADKTYENTVNLAATLAKAFNGKSEGQILHTIIAQAEQGKREGTLTNADLDNFYATISPLLDGFKRKKLQQIISKLKSI